MAIDSAPQETKEVFVKEKSATTSDDSGHESSGSTDSHVFSDPDVADYWRKKYEAAGYENRHRFDPTYTWSPEEEKRLVRKVLVVATSANYACLIMIDRSAHYLLGLGNVLRP